MTEEPMQYGRRFKYAGATVEFLDEHTTEGMVCIKTKQHDLIVIFKPGGSVRIYDRVAEWKP